MQLVREIDDGVQFKKPEQIYNYVREFANEDREYFVVVGLDTRNKPVYREICHIGTLNRSHISPREIFKRAVTMSCNSVVICHNHPSGDCRPSEEDIISTQNLIKAGKLLDITVLDHLIVSKNGFYSMKTEGDI